MPALTTTALKKWLMSAGFEVYRTVGDRVVLADRVRDNLIMDSSVSVGGAPELVVRVVLRALRSDFPIETNEQLFERARTLAVEPIERGYVEVGAELVPIKDPGNRDHVLDGWFEVALERKVADESELTDELRYALTLTKTATRARS